MVAGPYVALEVAPGLHRLELPLAALGIPAPPVYTELTLQRGRHSWRVAALASREQAGAVGQWLGNLGAGQTHGPGGKEPVLRARLARLPDALEHAASLVDLRCVGVGADGSAFLLAAGARGKFEELVRHLEAQRMPENAVPELTQRQAELLQFCKDRGYYEIPRRATLRGLAKDLGISSTALSKSLRRAEARILSAYVERMRHNLPTKVRAKRRA